MVSPSVADMANDYLKKYETKENACKVMLKNQVTKCTTSGIVTGLGGAITMPVADTSESWKCNLCTNENDSLHGIFGRA